MAERVGVHETGSSQQRPLNAAVEPVCPLQAGRGSVALPQRTPLQGSGGFQTTAGNQHLETKQPGTVGKKYNTEPCTPIVSLSFMCEKLISLKPA